MARPATAAVRLLSGSREPVRVATTSNIDLDGLQSLDGVGLSVNDRVLVKDQTDARLNGIYTVSLGLWNRAPDARFIRAVAEGVTVHVQEGAIHAGNVFRFRSTPVSIGLSDINVDAVVVEIEFADQAETNSGVDENLAVSPLTLVGRLKSDGYVSATHFGVVPNVLTDQSAAIAAALSENVPIQFPAGDYAIFEPMEPGQGGGIMGAGEVTRFIRAFTGGAMVEYDGDPIILEDFMMTTESGRTAAAGDDGFRLGFNSPYAQRGRVNNLRIDLQYDGFAWRRGNDGTISNVLSQLNERFGFYGINPRGLFYRCQGNQNKLDGWHFAYDDGGETGVDLDLCRTFANQRWGINFSREGSVVGANFNGHRVVTSFDGAGGISLEIPFTQFMLTDPLCEYHGWAKAFMPGFTQSEDAPGIIFNNTAITKASLNGGKFLNNKGVGMRVIGAEVELAGPIRIGNNGRGSVAGSGGGGTPGVAGATATGAAVAGNTAGLEIGASAKLFGGGVKFTDEVGFQIDLSIVSSTATGSLDHIEGADSFDAGGGTLKITNVRGALSDPQTVASAATLALSRWRKHFNVTGTATISAVAEVAAHKNDTIVLEFAAAAVVQHGSSLRLEGAANFTASANDILVLWSDGTRWIEQSRRLI